MEGGPPDPDGGPPGFGPDGAPPPGFEGGPPDPDGGPLVPPRAPLVLAVLAVVPPRCLWSLPRFAGPFPPRALTWGYQPLSTLTASRKAPPLHQQEVVTSFYRPVSKKVMYLVLRSGVFNKILFRIETQVVMTLTLARLVLLPSTNTAITNATFVGTSSSSVTFQQTISFDSQDSFFKTEIVVTNSGSVTLDNFRYMRTMNPLDVDAFGQPQTRNDVLSQPDIPSGTIVSAINQVQGPNSQIAINLIANDGDTFSNHGTFNVDVFEPSVFSSPDDRNEASGRGYNAYGIDFAASRLARK